MATVAKDRCNVCDKKFKLTSENTVVYIFTKPDFAMFSYFESVCSHCRAENGTFMTDLIAELMDIIRLTGCPVEAEQYPSCELMMEWCEVYGVKPLEERALSSYEEHEVEFFAWLLGCDPKYIWAEFE